MDLSNLIGSFPDGGDPGSTESTDPNPGDGIEGGTPPAESQGSQQPGTEAPSQDPDPSGKPQPKQEPQDVFDKRNAAFAQMRVENNQYRGLMTRVAQLVGLQNVGSPDELFNALTDHIRNLEARQHNVPVELLTRMEQSEQRTAQLEQERLRDQATLGFQHLKDTYGLNNDELLAFAKQLEEANKNPFVEPIDLIQEYRMLNYDALLAKEVEKKVQEVLALQGHAATHSTTPGQARGKGASTEQKVTTIQGVRDVIAGLK